MWKEPAGIVHASTAVPHTEVIEMTDYSFWLGIWKSFKNTAIVFFPAIAAGWAAFSANVPVEYAGVVAFIGGFLTYMIKNYLQVRSE